MLNGIYFDVVSQTNVLYVGTEQRLTNYGPWVKSGLRPVFVNTVVPQYPWEIGSRKFVDAQVAYIKWYRTMQSALHIHRFPTAD